MNNDAPVIICNAPIQAKDNPQVNNDQQGFPSSDDERPPAISNE